MKKQITVSIAALALATSLTACGQSDREKATEKCIDKSEAIMHDLKAAGAEYAPGEYKAGLAKATKSCKKDPYTTLAEIKAYTSGKATEEQPIEEPPPPIYDQSQVIDYLHLKKGGMDPNDGYLYGEWTYTAPNGTKCGIEQIMTDASAVEWEQGGKGVAATPEGNVGVIVTSPEEKTCMDLVAPAIADFEKDTHGETGD